MKVKCVAHLAYYMFAAVGVAAEVKGDDMVLRLNALEESVSTLLGAVTKLRDDNDVLKEDNKVLRNELISMRSRRTTSIDVMTSNNPILVMEAAINETTTKVEKLRRELKNVYAVMVGKKSMTNLKGKVKQLDEDLKQLSADNEVKAVTISSLRDDLNSMQSSLEECFIVEGGKLVINCEANFWKPVIFHKSVKIMDDVQVIKGNLMISNGADGDHPFRVLNGKGNLVIGLSELTQTQMGAHNIVLGDTHTFSSYGGLVVGFENTISGPFSAVTGGRSNTASGGHSTVSGGLMNTASGRDSIVSGGGRNIASGAASVVSGGYGNEASNGYSAVSGGYGNIASGYASAVSGGYTNTASGRYITVIGGAHNNGTEDLSVVGQNP